MDDYEQDRLESIDLHPSILTEKMLVQLGSILYDALTKAERVDEVEILMDVIGEYTIMASFYGDKSGRTPESLGTDLNEAALFKKDELAKGIKNEWHIYAEQFKKQLSETAKNLGQTLPKMK